MEGIGIKVYKPDSEKEIDMVQRNNKTRLSRINSVCLLQNQEKILECLTASQYSAEIMENIRYEEFGELAMLIELEKQYLTYDLHSHIFL